MHDLWPAGANEGSQSLNAQDYFCAQLVLVGGPLEGVFTPQEERGRPLIGVSDFLLDRAEEYFARFQNFDVAFGPIQKEIDRLNIPMNGVILDMGSGFGNTVIPMLSEHKELRVLATDISPNLLAILWREAQMRGLSARCAVVAMDAHNDYYQPSSVDLVTGRAILHHLIDPVTAVSHALAALKPGGRAIFAEPFQAGHAILHMAYDRVLFEAKAREESGPAFDFLNVISRDIQVRNHQRVLPDTGMAWQDLDDKWLFTRTHFERAAQALGCSDVSVRPQYISDQYIVGHTRAIMKDYGQLDDDALPVWAWDALRRFDDVYLTPELKAEFILEGVVTVTR